MMQDLLRGYIDEIHNLIEITISQLRANFSALLAHYKAELERVQERMEQLEGTSRLALEACQTTSNHNKLLMYGIPNIDGENLCAHFSAICTHLGYPNDRQPIVHLTRLEGPKQTCRSIQPILIEFAIHGQRRRFFAKYLRTRCLSQTHLGFNTNNRIFINEFLTATVRSVLSTALNMRRNGMLRRVFTKEGVVHAVTNDSRKIIVNDAKDLQDICK